MTLRPAGMTLVEILAALMVLAIGMTAVVGLSLGSTSNALTAEDRNNAALIISEAVADIERVHRITATMNGVSVPSEDIGKLLETLPSPNPNIHSGDSSAPNYSSAVASYKDAPVSATRRFGRAGDPTGLLTVYCSLPAISMNAATSATCMWPYTTEPKFCGGALNQDGAAAKQWTDLHAPGEQRQMGVQDVFDSAGYRVIYRLERHQDWHPHSANGVFYEDENPVSPFAGIYVLTLTVYRDASYNGARMQQVSDPLVVYLRDKETP